MTCILVTRPQPAADALVTRLRAAGLEAVAGPLSEYAALPFVLPDLALYQALVFTSAEGVRVFARREKAWTLPVFCVGDATAETAAGADFENIRSADGDAGDLVRLIREAKKITKLLHISGTDTAEDMAAPLAAHGIALDRIAVYNARLLDNLPHAATEALTADRVTTVVFFSARAAAQGVKLLPPAVRARLEVVCLSARVADALDGASWKKVHIAKRPQLDAMFDLLITSR